MPHPGQRTGISGYWIAAGIGDRAGSDIHGSVPFGVDSAERESVGIGIDELTPLTVPWLTVKSLPQQRSDQWPR